MRTSRPNAVLAARATAERRLMKSGPEELLAWQIRAEKLPLPEREYAFAKQFGRRYRFDFAWPQSVVAAECEGGTFSGGRHTRGLGFEADCEKYNLAALLGWCVLRFTTQMIEDGRAIAALRIALGRDELRIDD